MLTREEAHRLWREGDLRHKDPFTLGSISIPENLLEALPSLKYHKAKILVSDNGKGLKAVDDEGRRSSVCLMDSEVQTEYFDLWKEAAHRYGEEWLSRHPQYFEGWFQGENGQIIKYEKGDFFRLHNDGGNFNYDFKVKDMDVCRVLMVAIGLSSKESYEGGELVFPSENRSFKFDTGDVLCFPAPMRHLVTEVTEGTRHILIGQYYAPISPEHRNLFNDQFDREVP